MKIRLNPKTSDHCMKLWFDADKVYDAKPARNENGEAYRVTTEGGMTDNFTAKYFDVVEG